MVDQVLTQERNIQSVLCPMNVIFVWIQPWSDEAILQSNDQKETHLSVNLWKLYRANISKDKQLAPTTFKASSVRLIHCSFRTFKCGHPLITESNPLLWMNSESNDKVSRDLQCDPTASIEMSVIFAQAATPIDFNEFPTPNANSTKPVSVKPSQKRKFKSSSCLQLCPIAAKPWSPT